MNRAYLIIISTVEYLKAYRTMKAILSYHAKYAVELVNKARKYTVIFIIGISKYYRVFTCAYIIIDFFFNRMFTY